MIRLILNSVGGLIAGVVRIGARLPARRQVPVGNGGTRAGLLDALAGDLPSVL